MPWNKPGNNSSDPNDPWKKRHPSSQNPANEAADLFKRVFGGGNGSGGNPLRTMGLVGLALAGLYLFAGYFQLDQKEKGVVLQFGQFNRIVDAGPHWFPPFVYDVTRVNVEQTREQKISANMLTKNQNVVDIDLAVEYRIANPEDYVLKVDKPEFLLRNAIESALRHVVGNLSFEDAIVNQRESIGPNIKPRLQQYLDNYNSGMYIMQVKVTEVEPPDPVKDAYLDVNNALKNQKAEVLKAKRHANVVIPQAEGTKQKKIEAAEGYKARRVEEAIGAAARFESLLAEYNKAPQVTRDRLYLESVEKVLQNSTKVFIDDGNGDNVIFLPLDQINNTNSGASNTNSSTQSGYVQDQVIQSGSERLRNR
ncbi:MAG: FtsH protease activity modulator HflK [Pseudomonadota bacterium]|nr:FtsH protease activity modulator HflK [Pseudomonadota bacterium]